MPPCLTLSNIRYGSRVKWSNPGKGVAPSPIPWCSKLSKREPSGHPRLWLPTLLLFVIHTHHEERSFYVFDISQAGREFNAIYLYYEKRDRNFFNMNMLYPIIIKG